MPTSSLISVICSTYNRSDALSATLSGLLRQTDTNFEVIVADDGSTEETRFVIDSYIKKASFRIHHTWHEDLGFRLTAIRNLALTSAQGEYVLLLDGDCIPPPYWVANHRQLAEEGWTVSGQRILTAQAFCTEILNQPNFSAQFDWNLSHFKKLFHAGKINRWQPILTFGLRDFSFWRKLTPKKWKMIRGCNWGIWRKDINRVNGFNERIIGWGHEDADLAIRLMNAGVKFKSGSFATAVLHLWHKEAPRDSAAHNWEVATSNLDRKL